MLLCLIKIPLGENQVQVSGQSVFETESAVNILFSWSYPRTITRNTLEFIKISMNLQFSENRDVASCSWLWCPFLEYIKSLWSCKSLTAVGSFLQTTLLLVYFDSTSPSNYSSSNSFPKCYYSLFIIYFICHAYPIYFLNSQEIFFSLVD